MSNNSFVAPKKTKLTSKSSNDINKATIKRNDPKRKLNSIFSIGSTINTSKKKP